MGSVEVQILETLAVLTVYLIAFLITKTIVNDRLRQTQLQRARRKLIIQVMHLFSTMLALILMAGITVPNSLLFQKSIVFIEKKEGK